MSLTSAHLSDTLDPTPDPTPDPRPILLLFRYIDRATFKRVMGPLEEIMKDNKYTDKA